MSKYRSAPSATTGMPKGIAYIVSNEAAERFSFYGMKGILVVFMTQYLMNAEGGADFMNEPDARYWYHSFTSAVYAFPLIGAIIADAWLGKYKTILSLSIVYCLGHLALALDETRLGLSIGLMLIAIGSGGIKPCVSAHVGDQFGKSNAHLLEKVFLWFYFSINFGSFISTLLTPWLLANYGPHIAFGVPGGLMLLATVFFWMGRKVFIHVPPGGTEFIKETFSKKGLGSISKLFIIYAFVAMFWALFDQTGSAWVLQAEKMDRNFLGVEWLSSQIQALNPILVMAFIPVCSFAIYPAVSKVFPLTPLRKIGIGFFITSVAFLIPAFVEVWIADGEFPSIVWQLLAYALLTLAEVFVSITCLEFSYTQAPKKMKSLIMAFFLMSVSVGNIFTAGVNHFIVNPPAGFTPDKEGEYVVRLVGSDGENMMADTATIKVGPYVEEKGFFARLGEAFDKKASGETVKKEAVPPSADAGRMVTVDPGTLVRAYATANSGDADGDSSYSWNFKSVPEGSKITEASLTDASTRNPTFTPDVKGIYELLFTYKVGSQTATSSFTVGAIEGNVAPIVVASDGEGMVDTLVELDGGLSYDPKGDEMKYHWQVVSAPSGSSITTDKIQSSWLSKGSTRLSASGYYYFFAFAMFLTALFFIPVAIWYKEKTYIQDEEEAPEDQDPSTF